MSHKIKRGKLPFKITGSLVNTGYQEYISSSFKPDTDIVNLHIDTYAGFEEPAIQSPFTNQHVGGNQHRHIELNLGSDNDFNRPESFKINLTASSLRIYGPDFESVDKPRAQYFRGAKSLINISNIKNNKNILGNFRSNYEVLQTTGRRITNNLIDDNLTASSNLTTQFINGLPNYSLPEIGNNSKSIFVERFSAPGGKQESSRGSLDREGEEYSANNVLTTRNITTRQPYYDLLTKRAAQFGSSSLDGISIHKINRNTLKRFEYSGSSVISASDYDNFWVQRPIPRSDLNYAWITQSANTNQFKLNGYQKRETDIEFNKTFNYQLNGNIDLNNQTMLSSLSSSDYSYSSWKQIRGNEHPISIKLRKNNLLAVEDPIQTKKLVFANNTYINIVSKRAETSTLYREPALTTKYKPIEQDFILKSDTESNYGHKMKYTLANNDSAFANKNLNQRLNLLFNDSGLYNKILDLQNPQIIPIEQNPFNKLLGITYKEVIYPREENTYLSESRARNCYYLNRPGYDRDGYDIQLGKQRVFWRKESKDRSRTVLSAGGYYNSLNYLSTEELPLAAAFGHTDSGILTDNKLVTVSSSFNTFTENINKGIFNSIKLIETATTGANEKRLYTFAGSVNRNDTSDIYNNIVKRGYTYDLSGEWNDFYNDFHEEIKNSSETEKRGVGVLYRNTALKSYLSVIPEERTTYSDLSPKTEDEVFLINPRPRYVTFIGGAEVNKGEFIQNSSASFATDYFAKNFNLGDFIFSTLDNGLQKEYSNTVEKQPAYDSYADYSDEIRRLSKDYSIVPEFRISEHIEYYISSSGGNFRNTNNSIFSLDGVDASNLYKSSISEQEEYNINYFKKYLISDSLTKAKKIEKDYNNFLKPSKITLTCKGIKKLLPYNGFYPQERTTQLANLYADFIENNLHGGVYNLYNFNDFYYDAGFENTNATASSISVERAFGKYYMAVGIPTGTANPSGSVRIYQTLGSDETKWNTSSYITINSDIAGTNINRQFGRTVKLISASNGLNLFISSEYSASSNNGYLYYSTSSNGTNWSKTIKLFSGPSSNSKFGLYYDAFRDVVGGKEKIVFAASAIYADFPSIGDFEAGAVYVFTGSINLGNKVWSWTSLNQIAEGSFDYDYFGTGISLVSCSAGYQLFYGAHGASGNGKSMRASLSTNAGSSWLNFGKIAESSGSISGIGLNNIKAINYNNRNYLFFSEPYTEIGGNSRAGAVYVISSSTSYTWQSNSEKTILLSGTQANDYILGSDPSYSIEAGTGGGKLFYSFVNSRNTGSAIPASVYLGETADGLTWKVQDQMLNLTATFGGNTNAVSKHIANGVELPVFFAGLNSPETINVIKNNVLTQYSIKVKEMDKYYKQAALEPFISPGILYNTIKSGIAVDWPCATGSQTSIQPYGDKTIVNAYYPKQFKMFEYDGPHQYQSAYGLLRSNIDYRIPFENLLFPDEAFEPKDYLEEDLLTTTNTTVLSDNEPISKFLDKCYIYGGYEPYISPYDFGDINNLGPKKYSVPFVYRKNNVKNNGLYTLAMSNFLAETVKFFLRDEKLVTFTSLPDYKWKRFQAGTTYYMDVVLEKSADLVMMEAYHSSLHPTGVYGEKMNGRYFGYPTNKTNKDVWTGIFTQEESKLIHNDPAYAPYTPPYFEGSARARLSFKPLSGSKSYNLQEILDSVVIEDIFVDIARSAHPGSDAYIHKMALDSCIELFGEAQSVNTTITTGMSARQVTENLNSKLWIISPKMETPVLDFSNQELKPYTSTYSKTGGTGRGMWSGNGTVPTNGKGIKIRLEYPYARTSISRTSKTGSLLEQVGFKAEEKFIGKLADNKLISEAIVAIPYLEEETQQTIKNGTGFNFISIDKEIFNLQKNNLDNGEPAIKGNQLRGITQNISTTSISDMISKMKKYVIPPEFNFLQYEDIQPFCMYIFEFEHILKQSDLANIWQGHMPEISYNAKQDEIKIEHKTEKYEFFGGNSMPENLKWLIFRVKRRAEINYFNVTATSKDDARFNFNKIIGRSEGTDIYSYNWPYDYFSLVELAKLEVAIDYEDEEEEIDAEIVDDVSVQRRARQRRKRSTNNRRQSRAETTNNER